MKTRRPPFGSALVMAVALALLALRVPVVAQEYHVDTDADNVVRFISTATLDEFEGITDRIDGYVLLDQERLAQGGDADATEFYFEVDLASLDTGIGLRNRHMRDNYLETEDYPYAVMSGKVEEVRAVGPGAFRLTAAGTMAIHGVERELRAPCRVAEDGEGYRVSCAFQVLLSEYDIEIPKVMFMKLANEIRLELEFSVRPAGDPEEVLP